MADEVVAAGGAGSGGGADGGGGSSSPGVGGTSMTEAQVSAPGGDIAFLNAEPVAGDKGKGGDSESATKGAEKAAEETGGEEVDLSSLEEGAPEWLAKVADPAAKAEVAKLLEMQKAFGEKFKDLAEFQEFFDGIPGGKDQIAAMRTLVEDVDQLDSALEANTSEGNLKVAARYLEMTPDGGAGLLRAAAQHMSKANPEAWNQVSAELINSTLNAAGFGFDLPTLVGAIRDIKAAVAADDGEAWGAATSKLLGAPKASIAKDPELARAAERERAAKAGEQKAQTEAWTYKRDASAAKIETHVRAQINERLSKILSSKVSEKARGELVSDIVTEIGSQITSNSWVMNQIAQLIGERAADGKGAHDYGKAILNASQADFDRAATLMMEAASPSLIVKAVGKIVTKWTKDRAASNQDARDAARGVSRTVDVGAGKSPAAGAARKSFTADQLRARNERGEFEVSDKDFLNS